MEGVVTDPAVHEIIAAATDEHIIALAAEELIVPGAAVKRIVALTAVQLVVTGITKELVVVMLALKDIIAVEPVGFVGAVVSVKDIVAGGAGPGGRQEDARLERFDLERGLARAIGVGRRLGVLFGYGYAVVTIIRSCHHFLSSRAA
jgi:hypothetical protein